MGEGPAAVQPAPVLGADLRAHLPSEPPLGPASEVQQALRVEPKRQPAQILRYRASLREYNAKATNPAATMPSRTGP